MSSSVLSVDYLRPTAFNHLLKISRGSNGTVYVGLLFYFLVKLLFCFDRQLICPFCWAEAI